jgi:hypothetical protein
MVCKSNGQDLRHEFADLPGRKVYNRGNLAPDEVVRAIVLRDLRAGSLATKGRPKVDGQLVSRFASFRKGLSRHDRADANIDGEELLKVYSGAAGALRSGSACMGFCCYERCTKIIRGCGDGVVVKVLLLTPYDA